jgi:hypothetical protein
MKHFINSAGGVRLWLAAGLCALSTSACSGDVSENGGGPEASGTVEQMLTTGPETPWRGAAKNRVMASSFGSTPAVYAADIGVSQVCNSSRPRKCVKAVRGLQVFSYDPTTNTTSGSVIGNPTAETWTRVICPDGGLATGYNVGITSEIDSKQIGHFGLLCMNASGVRTQTQVLGGGHELFIEPIDCPVFTHTNVSYLGTQLMNRNGDGVGGICVFP